MWFRRYPRGQTGRHTDTQTDIGLLITILRNRSCGRSNDVLGKGRFGIVGHIDDSSFLKFFDFGGVAFRYYGRPVE